jgi:hypothetical protein
MHLALTGISLLGMVSSILMLLVVLFRLRLLPRLSRIVLLEARSIIDMQFRCVYHCSHVASHLLFLLLVLRQ